MKKDMKLFIWYSSPDMCKYVLSLIFAAALGIAFYKFEKYFTLLILAAVVIGIIVSELKFAIITDGCICEFSNTRIVEKISFEGIELMHSAMDPKRNAENFCIYGEGKLIQMPYRKKTITAILKNIGMSDAEITAFLSKERSELEGTFAGYGYKKSIVYLDELVGKKLYIRREIKSDGR